MAKSWLLVVNSWSSHGYQRLTSTGLVVNFSIGTPNKTWMNGLMLDREEQNYYNHKNATEENN